MINHILIPLDGSALAECVLPHVIAIARGTNARVTLLHVLELPQVRVDKLAVDPLEWQLRKQEAEEYLNHVTARLRKHHLKITEELMEGSPAECVIDYANTNQVDMIALSSHGRSGLSGWNVSSIVQKIILRSFKSFLLVRAYANPNRDLEEMHYERLFVGLDYSTRAEYILPIAAGLAQYYRSKLILGTVIRKPEILHRFPLSKEEEDMVNQIADQNYRTVSHYFDQLHSRLSLQGVELQTRLLVSDNVTVALHEMVEQENADLVMLVAHGHSGESRWPYGSIATSFIAYGTTSLMILQDLSPDDIERTDAEIAARETKGH